jgi:hypothetical protein
MSISALSSLGVPVHTLSFPREQNLRSSGFDHVVALSVVVGFGLCLSLLVIA